MAPLDWLVEPLTWLPDWAARNDAWPARWLFHRLLAAVYAIAFVNAALQWRALLGSDGILPVPAYLARTDPRRRPSLFGLRYSDGLAVGLAWTGVALALALVVGAVQALGAAATMLAWLTLYGLYLSYVNVGQVWYAFGWESILLEAGFFAAFLGAGAVAPPVVAVWMVLWLAFRVEFGAGLIKLRGDPCWRDLTCLEYHHETQPLPSLFSWHAHHLPRWWHRVEVAGNHVTQLVVPFGLFAPQPVASVSALIIVATQGWLLATGNFAWLNAVTIVLVVPALDPSLLGWLPVDPPALAPDAAAIPAWLAVTVALVGVAVLVSSVRPVRNMASPRQRMNARFNPLHLVGTYGAFGSITRVRHEVVVEGTRSAHPGADADWHEYGFRGKPGDPRDRPRQIAPYHLRLDWLLWFAAMSDPSRHPWFGAFLTRLLRGDRRVRALLRHDPFPDAPPRHIRATRYRYRFSTPVERRRDGVWWVREDLGPYLPPVTLSEDGRLTASRPRGVWPPATGSG